MQPQWEAYEARRDAADGFYKLGDPEYDVLETRAELALWLKKRIEQAKDAMCAFDVEWTMVDVNGKDVRSILCIALSMNDSHALVDPRAAAALSLLTDKGVMIVGFGMETDQVIWHELVGSEGLNCHDLQTCTGFQHLNLETMCLHICDLRHRKTFDHAEYQTLAAGATVDMPEKYAHECIRDVGVMQAIARACLQR